MSSHTIINLKQVEPSEAARAAGIDAHMSRSRLDSEHLGVSYFRYPPDFRAVTGHHHREQEEAYVVVAGSGPCASTTSCETSAGGMSSAWPPRWCAPSKPGPTGSS